jgi:hypothetical protein
MIPFLTHYSYIVSDILCMWIHAHSAELKMSVDVDVGSEWRTRKSEGSECWVAQLQFFLNLETLTWQGMWNIKFCLQTSSFKLLERQRASAKNTSPFGIEKFRVKTPETSWFITIFIIQMAILWISQWVFTMISPSFSPFRDVASKHVAKLLLAQLRDCSFWPEFNLDGDFFPDQSGFISHAKWYNDITDHQ